MRFRHARSLEVSGAAVWFALRWQYCRWGLFLPRVRVLKDIRHTLGYQTHPWLPNTPLVAKLTTSTGSQRHQARHDASCFASTCDDIRRRVTISVTRNNQARQPMFPLPPPATRLRCRRLAVGCARSSHRTAPHRTTPLSLAARAMSTLHITDYIAARHILTSD